MPSPGAAAAVRPAALRLGRGASYCCACPCGPPLAVTVGTSLGGRQGGKAEAATADVSLETDWGSPCSNRVVLSEVSTCHV